MSTNSLYCGFPKLIAPLQSSVSPGSTEQHFQIGHDQLLPNPKPVRVLKFFDIPCLDPLADDVHTI
jgi:hypothetical protein